MSSDETAKEKDTTGMSLDKSVSAKQGESIPTDEDAIATTSDFDELVQSSIITDKTASKVSPLATSVVDLSINQQQQFKSNTKKRALCSRCQRPTPNACICESLPTEPLVLQRTRILVLQHPHELKRKNRSVPLLELTLSKESLIVGVGRRLGSSISPKRIMDIIRDDSEPLLLLYPGPDAIPLQQAMKMIDDEPSNNESKKKKINILVLDSTWKYAREMDLKNKEESQYPSRMIRIQLKPTTDDKMPNDTFKPGRFDIRTPPTSDHLSTAECIAWIASRVETQDSTLLLDTLLKPLDCMVSKWKSFKNEKRPAQDDASQRQSKQRKHVDIK